MQRFEAGEQRGAEGAHAGAGVDLGGVRQREFGDGLVASLGGLGGERVANGLFKHALYRTGVPYAVRREMALDKA